MSILYHRIASPRAAKKGVGNNARQVRSDQGTRGLNFPRLALHSHLVFGRPEQGCGSAVWQRHLRENDRSWLRVWSVSFNRVQNVPEAVRVDRTAFANLSKYHLPIASVVLP